MAIPPTISVVLPVYNGGAFLGAAIESIVKQSFTDFELLMIDDGSTDSSLELMRKYAAKDTRIRILTRENRGLVSTLNEMIGMARGAWIARMDADDIALSDRFARQLEWLEQSGADVCGCWVQRFGGSDKREVRFYESDVQIKAELMFCSPFAHPSIMFRTTLARIYPYDDNWIKAEDYDLWVRAAQAGWIMTNLPQVQLLYRTHAGQVSIQAAAFQQEQGRKIRAKYWAHVFDSLGLDKSGLDECLKIFDPTLLDLDMNQVDAVFTDLLNRSDPMSRPVIFSHMTRLYIRTAANCPHMVARWVRLNRRFGAGWGARVRLQLLLFRIFRIREDGRLFKLLKMLRVRRTFK